VSLKENYRIILASKSPRRSQLLEEAGLSFEIKTLEVEENYPEDLAVEEVPVYLAKKKARASQAFLQSKDDVILAADSVVILDGIIYGKPQDEGEAHAMLRKLSGQEHQVITGVCLLTENREIAFGDLTKVKFAPLSEADIHYYVSNFKPYDKAGSYAIQEWIGLCKVEKIEGTYANVMGLPVERVWKALQELFK
jgi:septum formation protein